jgi:exodeoxyribonuclease VII small subunit
MTPDEPVRAAEPPTGAGSLAPGDPGRFDVAAAEPAGEPSVTAGAATPAPSYEAATERLEAIIRRLDSGEAGLRETLALVKEGRGLVEFCAAELDAVSQGLEELRLDELVARLEPDPAASARPPR